METGKAEQEDAEIACLEGQDARRFVEGAFSKSEEKRGATACAQSESTSPLEISVMSVDKTHEHGPTVEDPPDVIPDVGSPDGIPAVGGSSCHHIVCSKSMEASSSADVATDEDNNPPAAVTLRTKNGGGKSFKTNPRN